VKRTAHGENAINSYRAGFLTGFFCALLGLSVVGGAWWAGAWMGEKSQMEKRKSMAFEEWKQSEAAFEEWKRSEEVIMMTPQYEAENVVVEIGTPMSTEEIAKRLKAIEK
jgi:hypothetical protein